MKIAVRSGKDDEWRKVSSSDQQWDGSLQELIHQIPELISVEDLESGRPGIKICIANAATSSEDDGGLIGIDDNGEITIVECETADDSASGRKIVGQALEYAATLWEISYEDFDTMVLGSAGRHLVELMREKIPAEEWSEGAFKAAVTSSLNKGKFHLMIVTQGMTDELRRTIKFLGEHGPFSFEIYVVEMLCFPDGETEIIIPKVTVFAKIQEEDSTQTTATTSKAKASASKTTASASRTTATTSKAKAPQAEPTIAASTELTEPVDSPEPEAEQEDKFPKSHKLKEDLFFAKCEGTVSQGAMEMIRKLYGFSVEMADSIIWWGSGGAGAFNFVLTENQLTVFIVDVNGKIMFNFSEWQREHAYKSLLPQFLDKLKDISTLRQLKGGYTNWPDFDVEEFFSDQNDFEKFEQSIKFLKDELTKLVPV